MTENHSALYAAFNAKDARFDGRFFAGISSTGIYCRPVCRAKRPKAENCTFFATAAEAERAGYRPCLLCRPEQAPGSSPACGSLAYRAARLLQENCGGGHGLEETAAGLGCTSRHLRRVFMEEYRVTPVEYLQTCRLLLAKDLLTDTDLPVVDVAMAAGFGSLRRFNDLFQKRYRLTPTALRRNAGDNGRGDTLTLALGYRPPYLWEEMLRFLAGRAIAGVEVVKKGEYARTVCLPDAAGKPRYGWIRVGDNPRGNALGITVSGSLMPVLPQVLARVRHLFDLNCDPDAVNQTLGSMNEIRPGMFVQGIRVPGCFNAFEMAVRAVLGQQITVKAAGTLAARLAQAFGTPIQSGVEGLAYVFPSPRDFLALEGDIANHLGPLGVTSARSHTIYELARSFEQGDITWKVPSRPEEEIKKLTAIRGIGGWTAQYLAMRAMEWPDAFLETDAGIKKALHPHPPKEMLAMAQAWRPWRSYATVSLWNTL